MQPFLYAVEGTDPSLHWLVTVKPLRPASDAGWQWQRELLAVEAPNNPLKCFLRSHWRSVKANHSCCSIDVNINDIARAVVNGSSLIESLVRFETAEICRPLCSAIGNSFKDSTDVWLSHVQSLPLGHHESQPVAIRFPPSNPGRPIHPPHPPLRRFIYHCPRPRTLLLFTLSLPAV